MIVLVTIVHVTACLVLILTVLLQAGKGADIGAVFGGASTTIFGSSGAGNFLTRLTTGAAIVFMARTSTPWRLLPAKELGCGSPATAWRRLAEWARAGVFEALHLDILDQLGGQDRLNWSRASVDSASVRAKRGRPRGRKSRRSWQARVQARLRRWRAAADRAAAR